MLDSLPTHATIASLARTLEARDPGTADHTRRVARLACALAQELGFGADELEAVEIGALLHDIGKIGVPDRVLLKPGLLDPEERALIRRHPDIAGGILAGLELPPVVGGMVRHHHERVDGRGYPDGLAGESIPLAARILAVADSLDAMTSDRPYRARRDLGEALAEISACTGTQFCPQVVRALRRLMRRGRLVTELFGPEPALAAC